MPGAQLGTDLWINEHISPWDIYSHGVTRVLVHMDTDYQQLFIVETGLYGKALVLDGKWQSCTGDEFLYHEPLVHPACVLHGAPQRVLVLGGGEGATVREVLRWKCVKQVVMIDIDGQAVEACRQHLPEMHQGSFDDPRMKLVIGDALNYLDQTDVLFDVVISDLSDPIEHGPSFKLFTKECFEKVKRIMAKGGVFVVQAGSTSPVEKDMHVRLVNTVAAVFANVKSYSSFVPTYVSPWGFAIGTDRPVNARPDPATIDKLLAQQTTGGLRMFDGQTMLGLFQLPKHLRQAIAAETLIYTQKQTPKFFGTGRLGP